jgi:hypothetical protein
MHRQSSAAPLKRPAVFVLLLLCVVGVQGSKAETAVQSWVQRYNGPGNGTDLATAIAVDMTGKVFVTGYSPGIGTANDYATIAYSNDGVALWTNRYNGPPGNTNDQAYALALDASGNVFVTGRSSSSNSLTSSDYLTIKYSNAGVPLWTNRFREGIGVNTASTIVVDSNGNVIVAGTSTRYVAIAYSNDGVPLWTNRFPGNKLFGIFTAVDADNNVLLTGATADNSSAYGTVKYNSSGVPLWTNLYAAQIDFDDAQSRAVVADSNGRVFVTGYSYHTNAFHNFLYHIATVAYSGIGIPLWTNLYSRTEGTQDQPTAITVDTNGNVFVTGSSVAGGYYATLKYSNSGIPLWTNLYDASGARPAALRANADGTVYVTGSGNLDYTTIAYSSSGVALWTNLYNGPGNTTEQAAALAIDTNGSVFVTGGSGSDYATIKYSLGRLPGVLAIKLVNNQAVLSWTNSAFGLQSAPSLSGAFTNNPGVVSPYTNAITNPQQYFRLISN